jgi:hypothetical protein
VKKSSEKDSESDFDDFVEPVEAPKEENMQDEEGSNSAWPRIEGDPWDAKEDLFEKDGRYFETTRLVSMVLHTYSLRAFSLLGKTQRIHRKGTILRFPQNSSHYRQFQKTTSSHRIYRSTNSTSKT